MDDERLGQPVGLGSLLLQMGKRAADQQLARGDITKDEYDEIIKILYPPLSLVDDKKNGGVPRFQSGSATMNPGSFIDYDDILKRLGNAAKFVGKRVPLLSNLIATPMGDGTLDGYTQEEIAGMIAQPEDKEKNINKAIEWTPDGVIMRPDPPEEIDLEEWKKRNILSTPVADPPTFEDMTSGGGIKPVDPEDVIPRNTGDPVPQIELPTHTGHPPMPPKTLDDYILTMSNEDYTKKELEIKEYLLKQGHDEKDVDFFLHTQFYPERSDSFLKDIKTRSDRFLETYNEPLTRDPSQERVSVKSFTDLVPEGDKEMALLKDQFTQEYNKIANLGSPAEQASALKALQEASGNMYQYLINNTPGRKYNYTNLASTKAVDTRLNNPDDPYAQRITKKNLVLDYWVDKAAQYASDSNVPKITDADGNLLPALNQDTFFEAGKAIDDLKAMYSNHSNKKVAEWFQNLTNDAAGQKRLRRLFETEAERGAAGQQRRTVSYTQEIRDAVQQNVGYINDTLLPEVSFRSRIMEMPKVQAAISIAARKLDMNESFVRKQTENFLAEYFRSRDSGLRTGQSGVVDADLTKKLIEDSGLFNPLSESFMANSKEYISYLNKRKEQMPGMDLSHKSMTQNPDESGIAAFSGAEELSTGYLPEKVNREIQRGLERDALTALKEKDYKTLERLDREADKYGIETKIIDKETGETYSLGMRDYENYEFVKDSFLEKYSDELESFRDGGPLKFAEGSRLNDYDPYDINQFQIGQFPSYESLYGDQGKFPVDPDKIESMRQAALAEGKKFIGDATNFEIFREGLYNLPDGVINYFAGSAEGIGELVMGTLAATMKGAQLATTTDPDRITKLLEEPSFTKYMGAYRGKIPRFNLVDETLSGMSMDELGEKIGYYTGPPTAVFTAPYTLGKMVTGTAKAAPEISKVSKLADEEIITPISKTDEVVEETVEAAPKRTETTQVTDPEPTIQKPSLNPEEVAKTEEISNYVAPRWSKVDEYVKTKYADQPKSKKKLSAWKKEMEDADGAGLLTEMKDTGMSYKISELIEQGGDQVIDAASFLKIAEELLTPSNNQIKSGYLDFIKSSEISSYGGAAKSGTVITPEQTRRMVQAGKQELNKIQITTPGNAGRVLQEYKQTMQQFLNELEVMAGGTSKRTFKGVEDPSSVIEKYTKVILPGILRKSKNPNIKLLYTEAQRMNDIANRFIRQNINPNISDRFMQTGWPGTRVEDYTIMEQGFIPQKGQAPRHEFHSSGHPDSPHTVSFSRSIDKQTTDGRLTENIMEAQSDVHRGSQSYKSPEDLSGIKILEAAAEKVRPKAEKALNDAWTDFSKNHKMYDFDTDPINMPINDGPVPDMFEARLKQGTDDNPIYEIFNVRTNNKLPKKSFGTIEDAEEFIAAKQKMEISKMKNKKQPSSFDVTVDQVSMDILGQPFKTLSPNQKVIIKRKILDDYGKVTQKMIDDANEYLAGLTPQSKKELGKTRNPTFLNAQALSKLKVGDNAFTDYNKYWSRQMSTGQKGQETLIERMANEGFPDRYRVSGREGDVLEQIRDLLDASEFGEVRSGLYAGVDTLGAIKATVESTLKMPIEEFLAKVYPDEVKFSGSYADISKNAKLRRTRYETGAQDYPFKKQKDWVKNVLKSHIEKAISEGKTNVSWNPGEIVGVYESANAKDIAGYKTIYNKLMIEAAEDINKDLVARAIKLGLDPEKAKIKISGVGEDMNFTLQFNNSDFGSYQNAAPDLVKRSFDGTKMEVSGLPYIDFTEAKETIRKIGLPMHADGGRVGSRLPDIEEIIGTL